MLTMHIMARKAANPNPHAKSISQSQTDPPMSSPIATAGSASSSSSATIGRCGQGGSHSSTTAAGTQQHTYNVDRFLDQGIFDDGTLHGRTPDHLFHPDPYNFLLFYEARADAVIAMFDTAFSSAGAGAGADGLPEN